MKTPSILLCLLMLAACQGEPKHESSPQSVTVSLRLAFPSKRAGTVAHTTGAGDTLYVSYQTILSEADFERAWVDSPVERESVLVARIKPDAQARLRRATHDHIGKPIAVFIDGKLHSAPIVQSELSEAAAVTGFTDEAEARRIADGLVAERQAP